MSSIIHFTIGFLGSAILIGIIFFCLHGVPQISLQMILWVILSFGLSIPVHELIHGFTCAYVSENNSKTISYGINWKGVNAFCRYTLPVVPRAKMLITIMPCVVLAVIPAFIGLISGSESICLFAIFNFAGASKDIHCFYDQQRYRTVKR